MIRAVVGILEWLRSRVVGFQLSSLVALHLTFSSFGVLGLFFGLRNVLVAGYQYDFAQKARDTEKFFDWLRPYHFPDHKFTLYAYAVAVIAIGFIFLALLACLLNEKFASRVSRGLFPWIYLADLLVVLQMISLIVNKAPGWGHLMFSASVWLTSTWLPFFPKSERVPGARLFRRVVSPGMLIFVFAFEFVAYLGPFISGQALFYNDYFGEIPSYTLVRTTPDDELKLVDDIQYINSNRIWGHLRYDPRESPGADPACLPEFKIVESATAVLQTYVNAHRGKFYIRQPSGEMCFIGALTDDEVREIGVLGLGLQSELAAAYNDNNRRLREWAQHPPTAEQVDFIERNQFEIQQSLDLLEAIFHHHFQLLNPIKELSLGRPITEVISLYGLSFVPVYAVMMATGGVTYPSFVGAVFSGYLVYFALVAAVLAVIFRDLRYVAIVLLSSLGLVKALGYVTVFTGLGYSPVRHFHDVFVVLSLFLYFSRQRSVWLIAAIVAAFGGVLLDRMYGSFGVLAVLAVLSVRVIVGHSRAIEKWVIVVGTPAFALLFWLVGQAFAPSPYVNGFLDGVWGFPVASKQIGLLLVAFISAQIALAYLMRRHFDQRLYFSLFLVLYTEALAFYWLVVPNYGHLFAILPMAIFAAASIMRFALPIAVSSRVERSSVAIALVGAVILSLYGTVQFATTAMTIRNVERDHKVFDWPFKNTQIRSTMDPVLFEGATQMVQRWAPQSGVYVISQFDTLILWLSERYSLMPHSDLVSYLSGPAAHEKVVGTLKTKRPGILFVDSCIECNLVTLKSTRESILGINPDLFERAEQKLDRLRRLHDVFLEVKDDYELVERGSLISVYRLRSHH